MAKEKFDWKRLTPEDLATAKSVLNRNLVQYLDDMPAPDLVIAPDGEPYLYRWYIVRRDDACVYFHIQVASDPERPLHDHPWDNFSVILAGGYDELWKPRPDIPGNNFGEPMLRQFRKGDTVHRWAIEAHRLILPSHIPYTMTLFSTGPKVREWGFWYPDGWRPYTQVTHRIENRSFHLGGGDAKAE